MTPAPPPRPPSPSPAAQWLFDWLLRTRPTGLGSRLSLRLGAALRRWLVARADPLVRFDLDGCSLLAPLSHELAFIRRDRPQYATNLARIAQATFERHPGLTAIDVGANIGDTVAVLRARAHFPILCVEGDPAYARLLAHNTAGLTDVERAECLLADGRAFAGRLTTGHGSGRLVGSAPGEETVSTVTLPLLLEAHPRFRRAKLLKVDTDGFDLAILLAALPWLAESRPVLFFEYDPHFFRAQSVAGRELLGGLHERGYERALVYDNDGDFLLAAPLAARELWADLDQYFTGRAGQRYADICAFHRDDGDLHDALRTAERNFFQRFRAGENKPAT